MTAKDNNGKVIHTERRKYENWNLWFEGNKNVALQLWDITATTSVNLGLEPGQPDGTTNVLVVDPKTKSVTVEAKFLFEHSPDHWETIKTVSKKFFFESSEKHFKE